MNNLSVLILAAGEGTRMKSDLPKVLHRAAGRSLLEHVLSAAAPLRGSIGVVLGRGADQVKAHLGKTGLIMFFVQRERLGSGHAARCGARWLEKQGGHALVLCGDAPLIRPDTLRRLVALHKSEGNAATILTARVSDPRGYGRIVREAGGRPSAIVEEKDAAANVKALREINSGTYCFAVRDLLGALRRLSPNNAKGEYYLTDVIAVLAAARRPVGALCVEGEEEALGVNRRAELAQADGILRRRVLERLMDDGVTVTDPDCTYVDAGVRVGRDTVLLPHTFLQGDTVIGRDCRVGPFALVQDSRVGAGAEIRASFIYGSTLGAGVKIGPYCHVRPGTVVGRGARLGNFVEIKKSRVGRGAKVSHLTYIGDASLGADVNVGAGVITCNYDGFNKHHTKVAAGAFIGSNVNLVAPVQVGRGAIVGAGSTVTRDVPANALALERAEEILKPGWARRRRILLAAKAKND